MQTLSNYPSAYIFIECKNYSKDIKNPELDQLAGRFAPHRGRVGILHFRNTKDMKKIVEKCSQTYTDDRGIILPLDDNEMIEALDSYSDISSRNIDQILIEKLANVRLG